MCKEWPFDTSHNTSAIGANLRKKGEEVLYNKNICNCLRRSALGYSWQKGMKGGGENYLCPSDMEHLKIQICSSANDGAPMDTSSVLIKAYDIKKRKIFVRI